MGTEPLAAFHRRMVGIRADLRPGRKRPNPLGFGLVSRSRFTSDSPSGGSARISRLLPSERDEGLPSLPAFLRPDACVRLDRWSIFVLYMLQDLQLSYIGYGGWLAAGLLGQLLTLQAWGQFGDRFGNKAILSITGFTVPILPMLYLVSTNLGFLLAVNFLGGVIWAGLALGLQNYVFDSVRPEERAKAIALYSTVNAIGWSVGALLGSWLVESLPVRIEWAGVILQPASNLPFVFFLSGVLRLLVSSSLLGSFHETRQVERVPRQQLLWELPLVKPIARFAVWALPKSNR